MNLGEDSLFSFECIHRSHSVKNVYNTECISKPFLLLFLAKTDLSNELVRHFLIEPCTQGVRIKGSENESAFPSLMALIYQHSLTKMSLPVALIIPIPPGKAFSKSIPRVYTRDICEYSSSLVALQRRYSFHACY